MRRIKQFWQERDGRMLDYLVLLAVVGVIAAYFMPSLRQESACIHEGTMTNLTKSISKTDPQTGECQTTFEGDLIADGTPPSPPPSGGDGDGGGNTAPPPADTSADSTVELPTEKEGGCFVLRTVGQLQAMKTKLKACYVLGNDIDASGTASWNGGKGFEPVGTYSKNFRGYFDGKNHSIKGLFINRPSEDYIGLFGYADPADYTQKLSNVTLVDANMKGSWYVGTLVGDSFADLQNVRSINAQVQGDERVGGLTGRLKNSDCHVCAVTGEVKGMYHIGGIVGELDYSLVTRSSFVGTATTTVDYGWAGGIAGYAEGVTVEESFTSGTVKAEKTEVSLGGLFGATRMTTTLTLKNVYSTVDIKVDVTTEDPYTPEVGGLVGDGDGSHQYTNVYAAGNLKHGAYKWKTKGLVGSSASMCESFGTVTSGYWDTEVTTVGYTECNKGTGKPTAQMKTQSTYVGWDFTNVWAINPSINNGYPYLRNNPPN